MGTSGSRKRTGKSSRSKSSTRSKRSVRNKKTTDTAPSFITKELVIWFTLAFSAILLLSNFGVGGKAGNALSRLFFGLEGLFAYIFPFYLFVIVCFGFVNAGNRRAAIKLISVNAFVILIMTFCQLINGKFDKAMTFGDYFKNSAENRVGGGVLGAVLTRVFCGLFGRVIAFILVLILMIVCVVLFTEKSVLRGIRKGGKAVGSRAKDRGARYVQNRRERQQRREELLEEQRRREAEEDDGYEYEQEPPRGRRPLRGVTVDTTLEDRRSPVLREVHSNDPGEKEERYIPTYVNRDAIRPEEPTKPVKNTERAAEPVKKPQRKTPVRSTAPVLSIPREEIEPAPKMPEDVLPEITDDVITKPKKDKVDAEKEARKVEMEIARSEQNVLSEYNLPPVHLLKKPAGNTRGMSDEQLKATARKLQETLDSFGVRTRVTDICCGPSITRYELQPEQGVKVSRILNLADDIKLNLAAADIRIEAPIPGKAAVGIEVPNEENTMVTLRELIESDEFKYFKGSVAFAVGRDISGSTVVTDIFKMPHLLVGGATGSGKSVCINTLIMSILYKYSPDEVKFIMIDPKMIELNIYNGIPHLLIPVVTDPKKAAGALQWAVNEMTKRYMAFSQVGVRDMQGYNKKIASMEYEEGQKPYEKMARIVVVVDEFADLMMVASGDVEEAVCRLAQLARAAGIHLILATQRPSVDVITGLIKANMPSRIALAVSSGIDSRTIIDMVGAEKLLGHGDMLFYPSGLPKPIRVQGAFVSESEVEAVVEYIKEHNNDVQYDESVTRAVEDNAGGNGGAPGMPGAAGNGGNDRDSYFAEAGRFVIDKDKASIGSLQRVFKIGFNRAARIMDQLCDAGVVSEEESTKPRRVLMTAAQFEAYLNGDTMPMEEPGEYSEEE